MNADGHAIAAFGEAAARSGAALLWECAAGAASRALEQTIPACIQSALPAMPARVQSSWSLGSVQAFKKGSLPAAPRQRTFWRSGPWLLFFQGEQGCYALTTLGAGAMRSRAARASSSLVSGCWQA